MFAVLAAIWLAASAFIFWRAWDEVQDAYTDQIGHLANVTADVLDQSALSAAEIGESVRRRRDRNYFVIVMAGDEILLRTANAPEPEMLPTAWYVERARSRDGRIEVIAGLEREEVRQLAWNLAGGAAVPMLAGFAVMVATFAIAMARVLGPVDQLSHDIRSRHAEALAPLEEAGLPKELLPIVRSLNGLLERLGRTLAAERRFVSDASHELRTPLTAIRAQLETIEPAALDADTAAALERVQRGVDRAARVVTQLLALARAEAVPLAPPGPVRLDLEAIGVAAELFPLAVHAGKELDLDCRKASVPSHPADIDMLVRNLLENAIRHSGNGADILLSCGIDDGCPVLRVEDSGPGIPEQDRAAAFDRFRRGSGAAASGAGLGLSIVASVAGRLGAEIALGTGPALGGLIVEIRFPNCRPNDHATPST
ncbi:ATP-binding protein [Mangrovicoccus sp. HB161399]|uniref:ATP-binding protein n=1 Tax=Mangrovicoccus sp. HB161399 TaxID=2720392 RepID=UPI001552A7DA|nr:ATP-binding protein [Mangrovicoccus sp. HB161399]